MSDIETVRATLAALRSVPALAERYSGVLAVDSLEDLVHVPTMRKDDFNLALEHLRPRSATGATWMFQSGGSTGQPRLGYAPTGLYMSEIHEHWKALGPDDVFVNGWGAGRLWGAHYLMGAYADLARCTGIGLGTVNRGEYDEWLRFFADRQVTAIGGTPSVLRMLFARAREAGIKLPDLRKVLYLGEAWHPSLDADLAAVAVGARRWGLFGSTETWVVATNTPECAADTWHPLPSQLVNVGAGQMLDFTSLKPHGLNPVLRYQTGDAGEWVTCPCGVADRALRILGRRDGQFKFYGVLIGVDDLIAEVTARPGVAEAQLVLTEHDDERHTLGVLLIPSPGAGPDLAERVRAQLLNAAFGGPGTVFQRFPDALTVRVVDAPIANPRTGKVSALVQRREP